MGKVWDKHAQEVKANSMAIGILSLLSHCYAKGVRDACKSNDEMMCHEFIKLTDEPGKFGFMWKDRDSRFDMNTWSSMQFIVELASMAVSLNVQNNKKLFEYLMRIITPSTYHFCMLHIAQEFYKQGMLDYIKNPNPSKLYTILDKPTNMIWTKNGAHKKDRKFTLMRFQAACFDRSVKCEEYRGQVSNKFASSKVSFLNFQRSIWNALYKNETLFFNEKEKRGRPKKEKDTLETSYEDMIGIRPRYDDYEERWRLNSEGD